MRDQDIDKYAHRLAHALPDRPPEAERLRRRFEVVRVWQEGARYTALRVHVDEAEFLESFCRPGQYVTLQCGRLEPRFVVISSAPGTHEEEYWEFLIDQEGDLGEAVAEIEAGHRILLSPAEGSGYPADQLEGHSVLCFTTGAGIASVRPVMQFWQHHPELAPDSLAVYYGESDMHDFAYVQEFADWRAHGARVFQAVENLPDPEEGYRYVQHAFEDDAPELADTLVFVSGAPTMMELIIARLMRLGVPGEHIYINV